MQGATIRKDPYYRCTSRTMALGSLKLADHPKTVNLREGVVVGASPGVRLACCPRRPGGRAGVARYSGYSDGRCLNHALDLGFYDTDVEPHGLSRRACQAMSTPLIEAAGGPYTLSSAGPSGGMADALA